MDTEDGNLSVGPTKPQANALSSDVIEQAAGRAAREQTKRTDHDYALGFVAGAVWAVANTPPDPAAEPLQEALSFILHEAEHPQLGPAWTSRKRIAERARSALAAYTAARGAESDGESSE